MKVDVEPSQSVINTSGYKNYQAVEGQRKQVILFTAHPSAKRLFRVVSWR